MGDALIESESFMYGGCSKTVGAAFLRCVYINVTR